MLHYPSRLKDPLWYKDAIIYELRIGSFYDSDADGIGDFPGLTQKLDYLQELGVDTLWLLPFYPSPLKDDGYDISDYFNIYPAYGGLSDFKAFLYQAHERGLNVIIELVLNHTSDQHAWFKRAREAKPHSVWRNFYVWSQDINKYKEARIIFKDFEHSNWTYDYKANSYYWHRFYSHQPDLNYDNPAVRKAVLEIVDFWLELGVDGMRLDTIPYLFEREGTSCENLPETHAFVKDLRRHIDETFDHRMLLAEANQWPSDSVAYFGKGDECQMAFHFPMMPRLFMAIQLEDRFPLLDILQQMPSIPPQAQWALFLRNHDELTLEMVTDEERDYMYRTYAQDPQARLNLGIRRRLAPLLGNDRRKIELMNGILFSLPGTPILYYGDEIGMGDNIYLGDRNGVRTPMQWSPDLNAGFSKANPQRLSLPVTMDPEYHYGTINVQTQQRNPHSLLWWMRRLIALRKHFKAFGRGEIEFLYPKNFKVLAFIRRYEGENILVVANFSHSIQYVELDLSSFKGLIPHELFGQSSFPSIGELPYLLTMGPYAFYWFLLKPKEQEEISRPIQLMDLPIITVPSHWWQVFNSPFKTLLEKHLFLYLRRYPWFKTEKFAFSQPEIEEKISILFGSHRAFLLFVKMESDQGGRETYVIPLAFTFSLEEALKGETTEAVVTHLWVGEGENPRKGFLYDAFYSPLFFNYLLQGFLKRKRYPGLKGELVSHPHTAFKRMNLQEGSLSSIHIHSLDQGEMHVQFDDAPCLTLYRLVQKGVNPALEMEEFLTKRNFPFVPPVLGRIDYQAKSQESFFTFGFFHACIAHQETAWEYTSEEVDLYFDRLMTRAPSLKEIEIPTPSLKKGRQEVPDLAKELIGTYLERVHLIGKVTGQMHLTLADARGDPAFEPEVSSPFYLRSSYQSKRNLVVFMSGKLERMLPILKESLQKQARRVIELREELIQTFDPILHPREHLIRIRCHGDYRLPQLLFTGKEFFICHFARSYLHSFEEGRRKYSPFRDLAKMLYSFHFAILNGAFRQAQKGFFPSDFSEKEKWILFWQEWVSTVFIQSYVDEVGDALFIPHHPLNFQMSLCGYLIEEGMKELSHQLTPPHSEWLSASLEEILFVQQRYETLLKENPFINKHVKYF